MEVCVDLENLYKELSSISEQRYTNTNRIYWHGSYRNDLDRLKAYPVGEEKVPLAWVSNSIAYAESYAIPRDEGAVYHLRQLKTLNIWNPLADKDWNALVTMFPEYKAGDARKFLSTYDWLGLFIKAGKLRVIKRDDLLASIQNLNSYDGVFNRESWPGTPSLGVFFKSTSAFGIVNKYEWDKKKNLWRCVSQPNRVYDPEAKKFMSLKESEDKSDFLEEGNERQNFLERPI
jgi:hypothetical protein